MEATIIEIDGNKIKAVVENKVMEYELAEWVKPTFVKLGEAEIAIKDKIITFCTMKKDLEKQNQTKVTNQGNWQDDMVNFETLMKSAHEKKTPFSIKTECINIDLEKKYALFKAQVIVNPGTQECVVYQGHGDATNENVSGEYIKPHFIRMAETRAIARALRWYTNNAGSCAEEEKT